MFTPRSSLQRPPARSPENIAESSDAPSTIAASTTWPWPVLRACSSAQAMPKPSSMPPPPKSPTRLSGGTGASPLRPKAPSTPASAVLLMSCAARRERPILPPAGHAAVDEARVAGERRIRAEAEALHHAGPEALDEHIGARDELPAGCVRARRFQVERDRALAAQHDVVP